jgi:hypothetical protein
VARSAITLFSLSIVKSSGSGFVCKAKLSLSLLFFPIGPRKLPARLSQFVLSPLPNSGDQPSILKPLLQGLYGQE